MDGLTTPAEQPSGREQTLDTDWTSSVEPPCTDSHLGSKAKAEAICKASRAVVEHARTIDTI